MKTKHPVYLLRRADLRAVPADAPRRQRRRHRRRRQPRAVRLRMGGHRWTGRGRTVRARTVRTRTDRHGRHSRRLLHQPSRPAKHFLTHTRNFSSCWILFVSVVILVEVRVVQVSIYPWRASEASSGWMLATVDALRMEAVDISEMVLGLRLCPGSQLRKGVGAGDAGLKVGLF